MHRRRNAARVITRCTATSASRKAENKTDSCKYAHTYLKKHFKLDASEYLKDDGTTFGFLCRIITNGGVLEEKNQKWFDDTIKNYKDKVTSRKKQIKVEKTVDKIAQALKIEPEDRPFIQLYQSVNGKTLHTSTLSQLNASDT
ncbi:hypothetical protein, partial [Undibacterium luofuense]|uniref:hypothetical protein n=1 Tax=Undibacterium luofuense TaxID=2828733 RepID=UPI0030EE1A17